jgi:aminoglycoside phosphotransferase (APT) family kinase protein
MDKDAITPAVASRLVAEQFPQWAHLPIVPVALDGWDNTTFRLGETMSVRLPSHERYVLQIEKEHRWLPVLAPQLPLPIPQPIALGRASNTFPRPWSIYGWIDGVHAQPDEIDDLNEFARDLASFLLALWSIDASEGPTPGAHSCGRGGPYAFYDAEARHALTVLGGEIDVAAAAEVCAVALASAWSRPPVWVHGDIVGANLLVNDGRLAAVIDFGSSAVGDPACDLTMAWNFFSGESAAAFRQGLHLDDATWLRGRGWALWKAIIQLAREKQGDHDSAAAVHRFGWRFDAHEVVAAVIADLDGLRA